MEYIANCDIKYNSRKITPEFEEFLRIMLEKDPSKRASISDLLKCKFLSQEAIPSNNDEECAII
jgi:serine/threonine protein kinase